MSKKKTAHPAREIKTNAEPGRTVPVPAIKAPPCSNQDLKRYAEAISEIATTFDHAADDADTSTNPTHMTAIVSTAAVEACRFAVLPLRAGKDQNLDITTNPISADLALWENVIAPRFGPDPLEYPITVWGQQARARAYARACRKLARLMLEEWQDKDGDAGSRNRPAQTYTMADLRRITGWKNGAINNYREMAGVAAAPRGAPGRTHRWTEVEVATIFRKIIERAGEDDVINRCRAWLETRAQIAR